MLIVTESVKNLFLFLTAGRGYRAGAPGKLKRIDGYFCKETDLTYFKELKEVGELDTINYMMEQQILAVDNECEKKGNDYISKYSNSESDNDDVI